MILQSLVDYYEILAEAGEISKPGYRIAKVSYALDLSENGELIAVLPLKNEEQRGKKTKEVAQPLGVPEKRRNSSDVTPNFLCDDAAFTLGINKDGNEKQKKRAKDAFYEYKKFHLKLLSEVECAEAKALCMFLNTWENQQKNLPETLMSKVEEIGDKENIVFRVGTYGYIHKNEKIKSRWDEYYLNKGCDKIGTCLVTGKEDYIERIHPKFNVQGGTNPALVSFDEESVAYCSYGKDGMQGENAWIGKYAAFAYGAALNYLLADINHKQRYGDTTVVYWAKSPKKIYGDIFGFSLSPTETSDELEVDKSTEGQIKDVFEKTMLGKPIADDFEDGIDLTTRFYILGLAPNVARLSVRFFMEDSFGNILNNIKKHYNDLEIEKATKEFRYLPLWKLMEETVSPMSRDKASSPLLSGAVLRSMFLGLPYPEALYNSVITRIRATQDDDDKHIKKITYGKVAIIKACLLRKDNEGYREKYKEELSVSISEKSENTAYVLGRLFAALEKAQQDANPGINSTIKDRYFTSACATPGSVFPILLRLSNHHISKAEYGRVSERRISDLMEKLNIDNNPFPAHLPLEEQGIFILGYYHQQKANFTKTDKND